MSVASSVYADARASAADLGQLYRAFLGREAEPAVLSGARPRPLGELAAEMAGSSELADRVLRALAAGDAVPHERLGDEVLGALDHWLTDRLHCAIGAGAPADDRPTAARVLLRLFSLGPVAECLLDAHGSLFTQALDALVARRDNPRYEGRIEFANREHVSGWALRAGAADAPLQLEIRHEGRIVASAVATSYRPDIHRRLGGQGQVGFRARWNPSRLPVEQAIDLSLHDAGTGAPIGPPYRYENSAIAQLGVAQLLAKEFEEIKQRLDALAGLVPQALGFAAFPLAHYDLYRRLHRVPPPGWLARADVAAPDFLVLVDAVDATPAAVRLTIDSLRRQHERTAWRAAIVAERAELLEAARALQAVDERVLPASGWTQARSLFASRPDAWVVLLQAGELLDNLALAWIAEAARAGCRPGWAYWDEDRLEHRTGRAPRRLPRHHSPILRCAFDPDAMLELNVAGTSFAARVGTLDEALSLLEADHPLATPERERLVWALHRLAPSQHIAQALLTRSDDVFADDAWSGVERLIARAEPDSLRALLPSRWQAHRWQRVSDPVAASLPKPLVRWAPTHDQALISVLIPTRDHGNLVRECVDSLFGLAAQPARLDIVIADNGSTDADTLSMLRQGEAGGRWRVMRIDEPFNWSRLNNQMVAQARGERLLFLNNDTRMLTREWDDILRGLLDRPDVGAVGARLLYEDMSIQHGGVLFGYEGFVGHDAVGESPDAHGAMFDSQLTRQVSGVTGAFLACRRETFATVGGFDEQRFGVTFNDVDWCLRLSRTGLKVLYAPALSLLHFESKSRGFDFMSLGKQQRADHEREHLLDKFPGAFESDPFRSPLLSAWAHGEKSLGWPTRRHSSGPDLP
jgi:GT2 family glycosyltransferase